MAPVLAHDRSRKIDALTGIRFIALAFALATPTLFAYWVVEKPARKIMRRRVPRVAASQQRPN